MIPTRYSYINQQNRYIELSLNEDGRYMEHCCEIMADTLLENRMHIGYMPKYREYFINRKNDKVIVMNLLYCPWCGAKFPKELRHEWFELLEKEYGLDDPWSDKQAKLVPKEFTTDEWWKKRKL